MAVPYQTKYQVFCWSLTFRCSRYKTEMRNEIRVEVRRLEGKVVLLVMFQHQKKQRLVLECCEGYKRTENRTHCEPSCSSPECSRHGTCVRPDTCLCQEGYGGSDCSKCK